MPLMMEVRKRNGHRLKLRWGWWHVMMMCEAAGVRSVFDFPAPFTMPHDFSVCDVRDREVLTLKEGWVLDMWRG